MFYTSLFPSYSNPQCEIVNGPLTAGPFEMWDFFAAKARTFPTKLVKLVKAKAGIFHSMSSGVSLTLGLIDGNDQTAAASSRTHPATMSMNIRPIKVLQCVTLTRSHD